jgi:hypothetical protein
MKSAKNTVSSAAVKPGISQLPMNEATWWAAVVASALPSL